MSLRVGILSFAHVHAPQYAEALGALGAADFVGVADATAARGRRAAERYGAAFFEAREELFDAVEAVIVCSENSLHARDTISALEGGVHVLCEKPVATTVEDGVAMIHAAERAERELRIAFPIRHHPAIARAREVVRSGGIGRILAVNGTNHGQIPDGWFIDPELSGGGALMDHTVHVADTLRWLLGAEARSVYAEVGSFFSATGIDDGAILTVELEGGSVADGTFATVDPSWSRGDGFPTWGDFTLRITGTSGVLDVDPFAQPLVVFDHEGVSTSWVATGEDMNELMLADFLRCVSEGSGVSASGVDGLRALEVVLAAYRCGEDHEPRPVGRAEL